MQHVEFFKRGVAGFLLGFGVLAAGSAAAQDVIAVANGVNLSDGREIVGEEFPGMLGGRCSR